MKTCEDRSETSFRKQPRFEPKRGLNISVGAVILAFLVMHPNNAFAGSATWKASPGSGGWNTAANWTPATVPNGPSDVATFASSSTTNVNLSANIEVGSIVFTAGASPFTITAKPSATLKISGVGITNNSSNTELVQAAANVDFNAPGGSVVFTNQAVASDVTLAAFGSAQNNGRGTIQFLGSSRGGKASVTLSGYYSDGTLDISAHQAPGLTVGSIAARYGDALLGSNNLTVGGNDLSTTFLGHINDNHSFGGAGGGSLTKVGRGTLSLIGANSYDGGTIVEAGALLVNGSPSYVTIIGPVQVNGGTLGGRGVIFAYGNVVIGNGTSSGAKLLPGKAAKRPGTLQISNGSVIFNSLSTYECVLRRSTAKVSNVWVTNGFTTINSNVPFNFVDIDTGTLTPGTVFTVIQSSSTIAGRFSNLADGATFTSKGTIFKANYEGGEGNDLTLTVQ